MANEVSIKVSADAKSAVADFKRLTDQIHATEMAARRAGSGFQSMGNAAEHSLGRIATRAAQARREIEQMSRAQARPGFGAATGGGYSSGSFSLPSGALIVGGAVASAGIAAVGAAAGASYSAARDEAGAQAYLANAAKQTGQAYAAQAAEVSKLRRELGLTTAQAMELRAATLRFSGTIGRTQDAGKLGSALGNALSAVGRSSSEIPLRVQQLQTGQDELFDVLGPVKIGSTFAGSPEAIYKAYAKEILNVKRELTDLEKAQARFYAVLQAGAATEGAASERMKTAAGQVDLLSNSITDLAAAFGTSAMQSNAFRIGLDGLNYALQEMKRLGDSGGVRQAFMASLPPGVAAAYSYLFPDAAATRAATPTAAALPALGSAGYNQLGALDLSYADPFSRVNDRLANRNAYAQALSSTRGRVGGLVSGAAGNFSEYFSLGSRLNELRAASGGPIETASESASRFFSTAGRFSDVALATYRASGAFADADERAAQATRQFLVQGLAGADVRALSADQRAAYEDALIQAQEDQLRNAAETLATAIKMEKHLARLANKLDPEDSDLLPATTIQIDNRSDTVARFAAQAQGDALRSDQ